MRDSRGRGQLPPLNNPGTFEPATGSQSLGVATHSENRPLLLTIKEVAKLVNFSTRKIQRWKSMGWFPKPIEIGGNVRWRRVDIERWVADGCPKPDNRR